MRLRMGLAAVAVLYCIPIALFAQTTSEDRLDRLERRLDDMEKRHQAELESRDQEIARLRDELAARPAAPTTQATAAADVSPLDQAVAGLDQPASALPETGTTDLLSKRIGGMNFRLIDISFDVLAAAGGSTERDESLQTLQGGGHDPRKRGFTLQNAELSLSGAIDPYFGGEAHIIYFIDPLEGESILELEEAFLVTQQLPYGLQVEAGQMFTEFGRINPRHPHQWEWMDQPIINTRFFGPDGLRQTGVRVGWLTPLPWYSELHLGIQNANGETAASFLANDEFFEERSIGGRPFVDRDVRSLGDLLYLVRWENGFDINPEWNTAIGVSALFGPNATGVDGRTNIYGADFVLKWRPANNQRGWPFFLWQTEVMYRDYRADEFVDDDITLAGETLEDYGFYTQLLYGFMPRWRGGVRFEYASGSGESVGGRENDPFRDDRYRISPLIEFLPSEFSRIRLQYNYDDADHLEDGDAHSIWLGFEYLIGSHAAHKY